MTRLFQVRLQALMHKLGGGGGGVLFTSMKQLRTRTWYIFHQTKWFKNPLISVYVIHSSKKIRTLQTKSLLRWYIFIYSVSTHAFTQYKHMWVYKACISKVVCSLFAEDCAESWLSSLGFISWTGGGLTMVIGMTTLSERRPFISLCSWHKAHQCMQQCTKHGSHGEFCIQQEHELAKYKPENHLPLLPFQDQQILSLKTTWLSTKRV